MTRLLLTMRRAALPAALLLPALLVLPAAAPAGGSSDPVGVWPLQPVPTVVAGFDPPADPWGPGHRGVDLLGRPGQPVAAALPGRVSFAAPLAGRGVVVVDHGDTRTTYEPVLASVAVGTPVTAGQVLGRLDLRGSHCFPRACLHWGWRRGSTYLDPLRLVGATRVRLLPLDGLTGARAWPPRAPPGTARPSPQPWWLTATWLAHALGWAWA